MLAPNLFFLGHGAVPAERRLRREAAAAAAEEVRRAGRLEQGGAHHTEGFQEVRVSKYEIEIVIVKCGLDSIAGNAFYDVMSSSCYLWMRALLGGLHNVIGTMGG